MKTKILAVAAIICLMSIFAGEVQAMTKIINNGVEVEEYVIKIRRRVLRRAAPGIVIAPVIIINNNRYYRHRCPPPPPPPRCWRYCR